MAADFPYLYPNSREEARRRDEIPRWDMSFRYNVSCARAIGEAIRRSFDDRENTLQSGCAEGILEQFGFKRVNFVLAHSVRELGDTPGISEENRRWARRPYLPNEGSFNRHLVVDAAPSLLDAFIGQARAAYQTLGLFGAEHCQPKSICRNYEDKVLVLSPDALRESFWRPQEQLWYAHHSPGCAPYTWDRSIQATRLADGETTRWNRPDFTGMLDEQHLPDWARERLEELRRPQPERTVGFVMGGMT